MVANEWGGIEQVWPMQEQETGVKIWMFYKDRQKQVDYTAGGIKKSQSQNMRGVG